MDEASRTPGGLVPGDASSGPKGGVCRRVGRAPPPQAPLAGTRWGALARPRRRLPRLRASTASKELRARWKQTALRQPAAAGHHGALAWPWRTGQMPRVSTRGGADSPGGPRLGLIILHSVARWPCFSSGDGGWPLWPLVGVHALDGLWCGAVQREGSMRCGQRVKSQEVPGSLIP